MIYHPTYLAESCNGDIYTKILAKWADKLDNMTHARDRKLTAIAFATILPRYGTTCLPEILIVLASVVAESFESKLTRCGSSGAVYWMEHDDLYVGEGLVLPPHARRKVEGRGRDVVYAVEVCGFIKGKVEEVLRGTRGEEVRREIGGEGLKPLRMLLEN
jgi:hypothetical protein